LRHKVDPEVTNRMDIEVLRVLGADQRSQELVGTRSLSRQGRQGAGGGGQAFMDREATGYDHGYDAQKFYLGLALDPKYVEGFVEGCLERIGEDEPEDEDLFRDVWNDE